LGRRHLQEVFAHIHAVNLWGDAETVSGPGSSLHATRVLRRELPPLLRELGVRTLLDAACGDCHWIARTPLAVDSYVGIDIVPEIIAANRRRLADSQHRFEVLDLTRDPLPRADVILCRDCFIHLSFPYIFAALRNFKTSGAEYLLTTTYGGLDANGDILSGEWRPIDLEQPPLCFPHPLRRFEELRCEDGGRTISRQLGLWRLEDL